jgi:hypothetical protein
MDSASPKGEELPGIRAIVYEERTASRAEQSVGSPDPRTLQTVRFGLTFGSFVEFLDLVNQLIVQLG